ncbi:MAG: hypothetical protein ACRDSR_21850 [Pseudonocardiaceae bacterium]
MPGGAPAVRIPARALHHHRSRGAQPGIAGRERWRFHHVHTFHVQRHSTPADHTLPRNAATGTLPRMID